jgi:nitroreductase
MKNQMNQAMEVLMQHRSIRKYKNTEIPQEILDGVLSAASRGSTTGNMQVYSIIVSKDQTMKEKVWGYHFKQPMVMQAPVMLTFCADFNRFNLWCRQREAEPGYDNFLSFCTGLIDAVIAAQNAAVAAEALGLGICYLGTTLYNAQKIAELYECPDGVVPITTLVLGYAEETPELTDRLPVEAVVHQEVYKQYSEADIDLYYQEKEELPLTAKLLEENQLKTLAQIFTQKRYTRKDNVYFSKALLEFLTKTGYMNHQE